MEATEDSGVMQQQRLHSSFGTSSSSIPKQLNHQFDSPVFGASRIDAHTMPQFPQMISPQSSKKPGMPPSHPHFPPSSPYSMTTPPLRPVSQQLGSQNLSPGGSSHSRSLSQPTFFSLDSLPPLSPLPYHESSSAASSESVLIDVSMEERNTASNASLLPSSFTSGNGLPPRRGHRRSNSDIPLGFSAMIQSSPQLIPIRSQGISDKLVSGRENFGVNKPIQLVKQELEWKKDANRNEEGISDMQLQSEGEVADDLFRTYMNFDNLDTLDSSATEDKDMDSRASDRKTNGGDSSDNEVESSINRITNSMHGTSLSFPTEKREGVKRSAGDDIAPTSRHYRSISMDSFMGNFSFGDESPKPSLGTQVSQHSPSDSMDVSLSKFNMDFGTGDFSGAELKKIMVNEKLSEIALSDPKRAKRILANRQSAARSKERKVRYMSELEHKVQTLQAEATTLSAQVTVLQRDSAGLTNQNNELKFRLQAMEQQAQLRDALHETLTSEVQRLKVAAAELRGETHLSNSIVHHLSFNRPPFQLQHQRPAQLDIYQLQQAQHQQQQQAQHQQQQNPQHNQQPSLQNGDVAKHGSN